jgi:hypothetical protein
MAQVPSDLYGYASQASSLTGLSTKVILAQWISENGWGVPSSNNFGNIRGASGAFNTYSSPAEGVTAYANFLKDNSNYVPVLATAGKSDAEQLAAIIASPWDEGHYANGLLTNVYNSIEGISAGAGGGGTGGGTGSTGTWSGSVAVSDSTSLKLFFTVLGGALVIMGLKVLTDVPITIEGE